MYNPSWRNKKSGADSIKTEIRKRKRGEPLKTFRGPVAGKQERTPPDTEGGTSLKRTRMFSIALMAVLCLFGTALADDAPKAATQYYYVGGTWRFTGGGTYDGYEYSDSGTLVVSTTGGAGYETITQVYKAGTATSGGVVVNRYEYTIPANTPYTGSFYITYDGDLTETYTQTGPDTMVFSLVGTDSEGHVYDGHYTATRSQDSSGGGCSAGSFSPLVGLLFIPLLLRRRQ